LDSFLFESYQDKYNPDNIKRDHKRERYLSDKKEDEMNSKGCQESYKTESKEIIQIKKPQLYI
jgi:hypothetical protein